MPANLQKGPKARHDHEAVDAAAPNTAAPAMPLSAAFDAALGARQPEAHQEILNKVSGRTARLRALSDVRAPKQTGARTIVSAPRKGHR